MWIEGPVAKNEGKSGTDIFCLLSVCQGEMRSLCPRCLFLRVYFFFLLSFREVLRDGKRHPHHRPPDYKEKKTKKTKIRHEKAASLCAFCFELSSREEREEERRKEELQTRGRRRHFLPINFLCPSTCVCLWTCLLRLWECQRSKEKSLASERVVLIDLKRIAD